MLIWRLGQHIWMKDLHVFRYSLLSCFTPFIWRIICLLVLSLGHLGCIFNFKKIWDSLTFSLMYILWALPKLPSLSSESLSLISFFARQGNVSGSNITSGLYIQFPCLCNPVPCSFCCSCAQKHVLSMAFEQYPAVLSLYCFVIDCLIQRIILRLIFCW